MGKGKEERRLYILDSNGAPIGYVFMGGNTLYSMEGKSIRTISGNMTIGELKRILLKGRTWYIA